MTSIYDMMLEGFIKQDAIRLLSRGYSIDPDVCDLLLTIVNGARVRHAAGKLVRHSDGNASVYLSSHYKEDLKVNSFVLDGGGNNDCWKYMLSELQKSRLDGKKVWAHYKQGNNSRYHVVHIQEIPFDQV